LGHRKPRAPVQGLSLIDGFRCKRGSRCNRATADGATRVAPSPAALPGDPHFARPPPLRCHIRLFTAPDGTEIGISVSAGGVWGGRWLSIPTIGASGTISQPFPARDGPIADMANCDTATEGL
jgi:hypothetical protein